LIRQIPLRSYNVGLRFWDPAFFHTESQQYRKFLLFLYLNI